MPANTLNLNKLKSQIALLIGIIFFGNCKTISVFAQTNTDNCPPPILSRLQVHKIASGETIESIASKYNLFPETLIRLNPVLQEGKVPVGKDILIPPYNGIRIEVPNGATWQDLEKAFGVRAAVLFEVNGCEKTPKVVFIPGVTWNPEELSQRGNFTGFAGYPLPEVAKIGLSYGWQTNPNTKQNWFHAGLDLLADSGTSVLTVDNGIVAFVGNEGNYGNLVVINHSGGIQTRYAHLETVRVKIGQEVKTGDLLGTVGVTGTRDIQPPHLHFEVRYNTPLGWVAQDPEIHIKGASTP